MMVCFKIMLFFVKSMMEARLESNGQHFHFVPQSASQSSRLDRFESNRQHFNAPYYPPSKVSCKSTLARVESTQPPRIVNIRMLPRPITLLTKYLANQFRLG